MAVTSIWPIKGRVDKVINYARNPEKTTEAARPEQAALHAIDGVVEYAADEMKTEKREYVSCLNCKEEDAVSQFMETKRLWKKTDGRLCYHGYQSFKADEVDAATAHQIGVALAKELWGDRFEVVVATHCNTGHYHNHFVINSVSFADGYEGRSHTMINKTKGAWILARTTGNSGYSLAERQISALTSELQSEGYYLAGRSTLHFSIKTEHGKKEIFRMLKAAESGKISAVFVFSIKHISQNHDLAFELVDRLNELGVIVYDNEGYQYSYDWYCKQIGKRFVGGCR